MMLMMRIKKICNCFGNRLLIDIVPGEKTPGDFFLERRIYDNDRE